jgi:linoleoyl-CoA desaturase
MLLVALITGFDLGIYFTVSHNQEHLAGDDRDYSTLLKSQTSTTMDYGVGSTFWNFMSHGLNHQVTHHLFPSLWYHLYPSLTSEVVVPFFKKHGIKYHGEHCTFGEALWMHFKSLQTFGNTVPEKPIPKIDWKLSSLQRQLMKQADAK